MLYAIGRGFGLILLAFVLLLVFGCSSVSTDSPERNGGASAGSASVAIKGSAFNPESIEIEQGESVTWTNEDSLPHTVVGDGGMESDQLSQGDTYTKTFDEAGTFSYHCSIHPDMVGEVVVK